MAVEESAGRGRDGRGARERSRSLSPATSSWAIERVRNLGGVAEPCDHMFFGLAGGDPIENVILEVRQQFKPGPHIDAEVTHEHS